MIFSGAAALAAAAGKRTPGMPITITQGRYTREAIMGAFAGADGRTPGFRAAGSA